MFYPDPAACTFAVCRDVRYTAVDTGGLEMDVYGAPRNGLCRRW